MLANLTNPAIIPTKIKNQLRAHARVYRKDPLPYRNEPICESPTTEDMPVSTYRDVREDNVYQPYVGRSFIDQDEKITFRVQSVCLHMDYDVLLFKYYDEVQFSEKPELFDDPDSYEYSACSEMLKADSWCRWTAEDTGALEQQQQEEEEEEEEEDAKEVVVEEEKEVEAAAEEEEEEEERGVSEEKDVAVDENSSALQEKQSDANDESESLALATETVTETVTETETEASSVQQQQ